MANIDDTLLSAISDLIKLEEIRSVSCPFKDPRIWRMLVDEQLKRAARSGEKLQRAFCLCGPDGYLPDVPEDCWGGEIHLPYDGICDGDLLIYPEYRTFNPENLGTSGRLSRGTGGKSCNHLLICKDYGDFVGLNRRMVGGWVLYSSTNLPIECNPLYTRN